MHILNLKVHQLYKEPSKCHLSSCQLSCRRTSGQNEVGTLRLADTCLCIIERENFVGTTGTQQHHRVRRRRRQNRKRSVGAPCATKQFQLKKIIFFLIHIKVVLTNAKTHDAVLKRINPKIHYKKKIQYILRQRYLISTSKK